MKTALITVLCFLAGLVVVDVLWLNSKVISLEQVAKKIQEQINFLAVQQEIKVATPVEEESEVPIEIVPKQVVQKPVTSEVFIPLGSGASTSIEWVDTGAQAYVDTAVYPRLQEAYLQASLKANSGAAYARLLQKNEGGVIGSSEISHNTPTSNFRTSGAFGLSAGNKLYGVQIRSETGQEVFLENARLRLLLR